MGTEEQPPVDLTSLVSTSDELVASDVDGEIVMMSLENGEYYGLDIIGARVWKLLAEPSRVSDVCDTLVAAFDVDRAQCETDVLAFLNELAAKGLVRVAT